MGLRLTMTKANHHNSLS